MSLADDCVLNSRIIADARIERRTFPESSRLWTGGRLSGTFGATSRPVHVSKRPDTR